MKKPKEVELMTKVDFVEWFNKQPKAMQLKLITTAYDSDSQIGKGRRLMIRALEIMHKKVQS
jgi:hypothetical protein